ncbi:hypothetical protein [Sphingomonas sp. SRS2]|uniref:hypothetical protein n=1 Tax=Sphingomonas sp. SRS2 TaxID=133190 RepID=UPI001F1BC5EF|nr:hypothetical protein [Sphingomonas sp. SRS2]
MEAVNEAIAVLTNWQKDMPAYTGDQPKAQHYQRNHRALRTAIATLRAAVRGEESGWLIEAVGGDGTPLWLKSRGQWTEDSIEALRFARERDAITVAEDYFGRALATTPNFVTEHQWPTLRSASPSTAVGGVEDCTPEWGYAKTVGNLIAQLRTLDPDAPIYGGYHVIRPGQPTLHKVKGLMLSRERVVDGHKIDSSRDDVPYSHVLWSHEMGPTTERPEPVELEERAREWIERYASDAQPASNAASDAEVDQREMLAEMIYKFAPSTYWFGRKSYPVPWDSDTILPAFRAMAYERADRILAALAKTRPEIGGADRG